MARTFASASSQRLKYAGAPAFALPFAMACWFNAANTTAAHWLFGLGITAGLDLYALTAAGDVAGDPVTAQAGTSGSQSYAASSSAYSSGVWQHACGVFISTTSRAVYLNGGNKGTNTTSRAPGTMTNTTVGVLNFNSTFYNYMNGSVAEAAIWNLSGWPGADAAAKAAEFERLAIPALAKGFSPLFFSLGLLSYWPLGGIGASNNAANAANGDLDIVGGLHMSPSGNPTTADHPPLFYRRRPLYVPLATTAPANVIRRLGGRVLDRSASRAALGGRIGVA